MKIIGHHTVKSKEKLLIMKIQYFQQKNAA
jgi:hypothetical protein